MKYSDLIVSPVHFDEATHTYVAPSGQELHGTSPLIHKLFPNKYDGISPEVLKRAAERGTEIHIACQRSDLLGIVADDTPYPEVHRYRELLDSNGIKMIASEYLVSDEIQVATMIDCIDQDGNLYDIKTTSTFYHESVSWQLSVCAYLFELQNPHLRAGKLYGIHLRGKKGEIIEVHRHSNDEIRNLLMDHALGITTDVAELKGSEQSLAIVEEIESRIIDFKKAIEDLESRKKVALDQVAQQMKEHGMRKLETDRVIISLVGESESTSIDAATLRERYPDIARECSKITKRKGYVKITLRGV